MKKIPLIIFALFLTNLVFAQEKDMTAFQFSISDSLNYQQLKINKNIVERVFHTITESLIQNGIILEPDSEQKKILIAQNGRNFRFSGIISKYSPITGGVYTLYCNVTSEENYYFRISHTSSTSTLDKSWSSEPYSIDWLEKEDAQELIALEMLANWDGVGLNDSQERRQKELLGKKAQFEHEMEQQREEQRRLEKKEREKYTALSFLPPVNQFRSKTSKGTANGIAIVSGYTVSIGGFIWSTVAFNGYKRSYDNVSVDLTEADKARKYYKDKMDFCRGGQIASGILFIGSYVYGVVNALTNRDTYQSCCTNVSFAPIAYDNGAGIALVYKF